MPDLSNSVRSTLQIIETVVVILFSVEYLLRLAVSERKLGFATSFFGLVDLIAILPFYISLGIDLRSIRALRFLRLFRVLKMARYTAAIKRFHLAFNTAREELIIFMAATGIMLYFSAVGIYYFESKAQPEVFGSVPESLWWAVATLTTVGYGDVYPITVGGKVFTFIMLMLGLGLVSVPAGLIAAALKSVRKPDRES